MSETRKIAAILVADVVGYSRLAGADEDRTLSRLRGLRSDLIDPAIAAHHGRVVKSTGDGALVEFRSVVDAVRCAVEVQNGLAERNAGLPPERRIEFRIGIHLGDVVEEADGDLMGDGVNIAARLEGIAKPGAICLSEDAYRQVKGRLDLAVADLGEQRLKNIADPVRVYSLDVDKPAHPKPTKRSAASQLSVLLIAGMVALIVIAGVAWYMFGANKLATLASNTSAPSQATHLSIVVLPFANLSGDARQDYFADSVTENLTTDLSRIRNSFVIARNTAFTFKGKDADAKAIGKGLGVRYVLEGSVQRDQNRVRVNAQLIDTESGAHLWADRFEEDIADLFKLQDQVVARLANALGPELVKAEAEKGSRSNNPDAIDLTMRGRVLLSEVNRDTRDKNDAARSLFEQALKLDPNNADALAGEAMTYFHEDQHGWRNPGTDYDAKILGLADRAIALSRDNVAAYEVKSYYLTNTHRWNEALLATDAGLAINPNSAGLYAARGWPEANFGHFEQAISDVQQAMRLSPRDPSIGSWHLDLGSAELGLLHFDAAIEEFQKANYSGCCDVPAYLSLAAAYALEGKMDEAKSALAEARRLEPRLTVKFMVAFHAPNLPPLFEGLRKAGLPEEEAAHLSIVVLPFTNLSNDPSQDYFADGITENLTTELSRIHNSFVIARNTAFTYKGKDVDVKEIGKEVGVRYVLEGSVQRDQNRVRVNAQLINAESGAHLWADRFEEDVADLFKLQDELVARLANSLGNELFKAEAGKSARSKNPDAIDLTMRGQSLLQLRPPPKDMNDAARALFEQALKIDPNEADALAGEASTYANDYADGRRDAATDYDAKILGQADRAIALAPDNVAAYMAKTYYKLALHHPDEALRYADAALAINPNSALLYAERVTPENSLGRFEQAKSDAQAAIRLSPRDPQIGRWHVVLGDAETALGHFDAGIDEYHWAQDHGDRGWGRYADLAAAYALAGKMDEAKAALAEARRLEPKLTIKWLHSAIYAPDEAYWFEGLRRAGLPEE